MKSRTLQLMLCISFLFPLAASGQRNSTRRASAEIKSSGLMARKTSRASSASSPPRRG
jgi:hypothetical protein